METKQTAPAVSVEQMLTKRWVLERCLEKGENKQGLLLCNDTKSPKEWRQCAMQYQTRPPKIKQGKIDSIKIL